MITFFALLLFRPLLPSSSSSSFFPLPLFSFLLLFTSFFPLFQFFASPHSLFTIATATASFTSSSSSAPLSPQLPPPPVLDQSPGSADATTTKMPYRTDLKRPDLKGQFPCNVCGKVFCHSSSLSRHRMQAHFKSYTCTQCNQEIASSDTLRSHMYRFHQIQRMFMCRCCNWAFPDKTSLHIHMQSMQKSGMPGDVSVLARSSIDKEDLMASAEGQSQRDNLSQHSFGSPSNNSSPDEAQLQVHDNSSVSPMPNEMEEQKVEGAEEQQHRQHQRRKKKTAKAEVGDNDNRQQRQPYSGGGGGGIFPIDNSDNNLLVQQPKQQLHPPNLNPASMEFLMANFGGKPLVGDNRQELRKFADHLPPPPAHLPPTPMPSFASAGGSLFQQQWLAQLLANNPFFASALENCLQNGNSGALSKGVVPPQQQQPNQNVAIPQNNSQMKMLQALFSAATSHPSSSACATHRNIELPPGNHHGANVAVQPPQKKAKTTTTGRKGTAGRGGGGEGTTTATDLSVQIPKATGIPRSSFGSNEPTTSPAMSDSRRLSSLIDSLLQFKDNNSRQGSPAERDRASGFGGGDSSGGESERKNKRKSRVPTRATEMADIVYGEELEVFCGKQRGGTGAEPAVELGQAVSENVFPSIQRLMAAHHHHVPVPIGPSDAVEPQQPSPAVSDSQTSGSSNGGGGMGMHGGVVDPALISPTTTGRANPSGGKCCGECQQGAAATDGKAEDPRNGKTDQRIRKVAERIKAVVAEEEGMKAETREELMDCARELEEIAGEAEER